MKRRKLTATQELVINNIPMNEVEGEEFENEVETMEFEMHNRVDTEKMEVQNLPFNEVVTEELKCQNLALNEVETEELDVQNLPLNEVETEELECQNIPLNEVETEELDVQKLPLNEVQTRELEIMSVPLNEVETEELDVQNLPLNNVENRELEIKSVPLSEVETEELKCQNLPLNEVETEELKSQNLPLKEMDVFDIENLPDVPLRRILYFLSHRDARKLRCLSKWFERRITLLKKSLFKTFYILITIEVTWDIYESLLIAMAKDYAPKKLVLKVIGSTLSKALRHILEENHESIISLDIPIYAFNRDEKNLNELDFSFGSLESLSLRYHWMEAYGYNSDTCNGSLFQVFIAKHSQNLKYLKFKGVGHKMNRLSVPPLPLLEGLALENVDSECSRTLIGQTRKTISSLEMIGTDVEQRGLSHAPSIPSHNLYRIINIKHLTLDRSKSFNYVLYNVKNIVSLDLIQVSSLPVDTDLPTLPNLRELCIAGSNLLPILTKCRETVQLLVIWGMYEIDSDKNFTNILMPRLTDLYMISVSNILANMLLSDHQKSLEFLCLSNVKLLNLNEDMWMSCMKSVVLASDLQRYCDHDRDEFADMCPNAQIFLFSQENKYELRNLVKLRNKRKGFIKDMEKFICPIISHKDCRI